MLIVKQTLSDASIGAESPQSTDDGQTWNLKFWSCADIAQSDFVFHILF